MRKMITIAVRVCNGS